MQILPQSKRRDPNEVRLTSARAVRDLLLAGGDDELVDRLVDYALDAIAQRDATREILGQAIMQIGDLSTKLDAVRRDNLDLRERLRQDQSRTAA